jgi:hypothetical protein
MHLTKEQKELKIQEISRNLGVPINILLEGKTKDQVIMEYNSGKFKVLND